MSVVSVVDACGLVSDPLLFTPLGTVSDPLMVAVPPDPSPQTVVCAPEV